MIFCVGANHKTANIAVRESLFIDTTQLGRLLPQLSTKFKLPELVILSTCNRLEIFGAFEDEIPSQDLKSLALQVFESLYQLHKNATNNQWDFASISKNIYVAIDEKAVEHIFRVAAGLESMVVGETQIIGQFKNAFQQSTELNLLGATLGRLFQDAIFSARRVRTETPIGKKIVSVGHCAVDLTKKIMGETSTLNYLVVGAGEMASTLCKHLVKTKPRSLTVISPDGSTAKRLCAELNFGVGMTLLDLQSELSFADCVITATRSQEYLVNRELAENVCSRRRGRPFMFVDISLPRNIDPQIAKVDDAYVFDIDDLKQIVDVNYKARESALDQASAIISEGVKAFMSRQKVSVIFPIFEQLNSYFSRLMVREFDRTFSKNIFADLSEDQKEALANLKASITTKLTADFSQNMRRDSHDIKALVTFLQALFENAISKDNQKINYDK